ncbi:TniB family NTP-binding protein [Pseudorhizobium pelagicum]|uniref:TniB protein n=1 Tax=Pseudorhizobium pelagicum TaxID=1509405 RepID=A0A922TBT3_9HYPH|nr:TniB family NTP-binding protein [Pseudorhizobium pelagicum]KEQ08956.1 hypothetical protein GV67_10620 [Pseudorhizobium pelagicum]KEQ09947.1 hypothetical protein GV68_21640 [Pseudorhizobium pelagicum]
MIPMTEFHETSYANDNHARAEMLKLSPTQRQAKVDNLLFRYPRFEMAYQEVLGLHRQGAEGGPIKGEVVGFLGNSRAGKTSILKALIRDSNAKAPDLSSESAQASGLVIPMAHIEVKDRWGAPDLATALYMATGASSVPYIGGKSLEIKCVRRVASLQTTFVMLDDSHFIFEAPPAKRKALLSLIKALVDSGTCSVLLAGLNLIEVGIMENTQLLNRGSFPAVHLLEHDMSYESEEDEYLEFLAAVSERLPFAEDSGLDRNEWITEWKLAANGSVGLTMNIIKDAARRAIADGARSIEGRHLKQACFMRKRIGDTTYPFQEAA